MRKPRSSSVRTVVVTYVAAFGALALGLAAIGYVIARDAATRDVDAEMVSRMDELRAAYGAGGMPKLRLSIERLTAGGLRAFSYLLVDAAGHPLAGAVDVLPKVTPGWSEAELYDRDDDRKDQAHIYATRLNNGTLLAVIVDRDITDRYDRPLLRMFVIGFGVLAAMAILGGVLIDRLVRSRLASIVDTARAITAGNLDRRAPLSGRADEFDNIASVINMMLDRLNALLVEVRRTTSFLAHDLRAPLIELERELALDAQCCADRVNCLDTLGRARERTIELRELFDAILRICQSGGGLFIDEVVDISSVTGDLAESFALVAEEQGSQLRHGAIVPGIRVRADQHLINQLVVNLLDNSIRHAGGGAAIDVSLQVVDGQAVLRVENDDSQTGRPDMPDEPAGRGRFGLQLVRAIATAHGGHFETERRDGKFAATAGFPVAK